MIYENNYHLGNYSFQQVHKILRDHWNIQSDRTEEDKISGKTVTEEEI
jgi:hypothetical protein